MASLTCLRPTHPHLHRGSVLLAISNRCFNHSSLLNWILSVNPPRTAPPRAMAKPCSSPAQDLVASRKLFHRLNPISLFSQTSNPNLSLCVFEAGDFEFVLPLKIVEYPDPRLRARNKRIVAFDDSLKKLVHEMFDVMYKTDGIGLSAPQLGINVQLMVFNPVGEHGEGEEIVLVNPRVSQYSKKLTLFNEGCLSFPGINANVKRPESVKIDARDINGTRFSVNLSDLPARIFQHEFDHLQGILFFERMTEEVLDSICGQLQALETKYEGMTGLPSPEKIENRRRRKVAVGFGKR
ncbi:hypothetical protein AAZX31_19G056800 [Glycine max]